jgi:Amt family ammonium transporter
MILYPGSGSTPAFSVTGLFYGNSKQFFVQLLALVVILVYDGLATFVVINIVRIFVPLRMPDKHLEVGDEMVHGDVSLDLGTLREGIEPPSVPVTHEAPGVPVAS